MADGYSGRAAVSDNIIKTDEVARKAKPRIMTPPQRLTPPTLRPGYRAVVLPTWCSPGGVCSGVVTNEYQRRLSGNLPPMERANTISDPTIALLQ